MDKRGRILATGYIPETEDYIYINGTGRTMIITNLECVNTDVGTQILNIRVKPKNGVAVYRSPYNMNLAAGDLAVWNYEDQIVLMNGDGILGDSGTADVITFMVAGYEGI